MDRVVSRLLGRPEAVVLLVVAAAGAVALAAPGAGPLVAPPHTDPAAASTARLLGALGLGAGAVTLALRRRGHGRSDVDPTVAALMRAGTLMAVLAVVSILLPGRSAGRAGPGSGGVARDGGSGESVAEAPTPPPAATTQTPPSTGGPGLPPPPLPDLGPTRPRPPTALEALRPTGLMSGLANLVLVALVVGVVVAGILARRSRRPRARDDEPEPESLSAAAAAEGLRAAAVALDDLRSDPAARIREAYRRLVEALSEAGAPRRPEQAPHEHLQAALAPLGVTPEPMHRLATLYVAAEFGSAPAGDADTIQAADALAASLASLARPAPEVGARGGSR